MPPLNLTEYLADTVFEDLAEIARRCRRWGVLVEEAEGQLTLTPSWQGGIAGAIAESTDPIARAVILAFVVLGPLWPQVAPRLLDEVNRRWRERRAGERGVTYVP